MNKKLVVGDQVWVESGEVIHFKENILSSQEISSTWISEL